MGSDARRWWQRLLYGPLPERKLAGYVPAAPYEAPVKPAEFRARLRIKQKVWKGCILKSWAPSPSGRILLLKFENFPWSAVFDTTTQQTLAYRRYGHSTNWPDDLRPQDLLRPGMVFDIRVSPVLGPGPTGANKRYYLNTRIIAVRGLDYEE